MLFRCSARALRAASAGTAALAGLALAGCGAGQAPAAALPAKPAAAATVPARPSSPPPTPAQAAATAYAGYWQAYGQAMSVGRPAAARRILAPFTAPAITRLLISSLQRVWAAREAAYGAARVHVLSVAVTGRKALVHDCLDLSHFGVVSTVTGRVVPASFGLPNRNYYITLVLSGSRWLVSNMQPVEVPCQP